MKHYVKISVETKEIGRGANVRQQITVKPSYLVSAKDIMKKGGNFYAVLDRKTGMWSTNQQDVYRIIDEDIFKYADEHYQKDENGKYYDSKESKIVILSLEDSSTKQLIEFNKWFNNLPPNHNYKPLDSDLTFLSDEVTPDMYRSKRLTYDLTDSNMPAYEKIISTLYLPEDREKIEWAIGSVLSGDSKKIEKFIVLYGSGGTGKSTILDLIEKIFDGYWSVFVAEELALKSNQFATAAFKDNPLVAIQDDGSLAKIDSPRINEIVSHKITQINEKNTKQYPLRPQAMLFMATNDKVDMKDTNLGITRRLLDVYPSGNLLPVTEYRRLVYQMMNFEIASIANHCLKVYEKLGKEYYAKYVPRKMIEKTNYIYNFLFDNADELIKDDPITRDLLYLQFKTYCTDSNFAFIPKRNDFCEQVKTYYNSYNEVGWFKGHSQRHVLVGFKKELFERKYDVIKNDNEEPNDGWLKLNHTSSIFDKWCIEKGFPAQYDTGKEKPIRAWSKIKTTMKDIDSSKLHWINIPAKEKHIRIDFDFKDKNGKKDLKKNMEEASKFPPTYAEISQSGGGIHLHYFYDGDASELDNKYSKDIEIKTDKGDGGCRRKLTKCNDIPIATLHKGSLPLKEKKMVDFTNVKDERHLRNMIFKNLRKEIHPGTKPSVDFIYKILNDAYESGMTYDVSDLQPDILAFANNSTNHGEYCVNLVHKMKFKSEEELPVKEDKSDAPIVFYDVEVFPNLFLVNWKYEGEKSSVVRMINPSPSEIANLCKFKLIGFNNRRYDNHMLYARMMGYSTEGLYDLSQRIINGDKNAFFREAYNLSYTDIYDFSNTKQSLKKWEIELGIHHQELGLPWDQPVPENMWEKVAEYCDNDVIATEAVFNHLHEDWTARKILALLSGLTVNDTTNSHTTRIIIGDDKNPWDKFEYTDLSIDFPGYEFNADGIPLEKYNEGTKIIKGKSLYLGEDPGEGGYVYSEDGMYRDVALLDIASMHPNSARNMNIFGIYQPRYNALIDARLGVKHKDFDEALKNLLIINPNVETELRGYLSDAGDTKSLAYALKIPINAVYGLTSTTYENKLKDPRNIDNIVAKRGSLFMINLKHEVQNRGFTVAHIKTDSIKIPNATHEIISFVMEYGKKYGYTFEHEATYKKMCLVNEAVYIAQYDNGEWTATGAEFQHPYIFKSLFSKEKIEFKDYCETKSVQKGELYLDMNEDLPEDEHNMQFVGRVGSFVPIKPGSGGGILYRLQNEKKFAVTGTKGYRWLEAETVQSLNKFDDIDISYYDKLCADAVEHISEYGDFDRFVNDPDYDPRLDKLVSVPEGTNEEVPFEEDFINKPIDI